MKKHLIAICNIMLSLAFCHEAFINAEASPRRGAVQKNEYINVFKAVNDGDLEAVKKCPPKAFLRTNRYGETPLHNALRLKHNNPEYPNDIITHIISEAPECINIKNNDGYVPMHDAAKDGLLDIVTSLAENGADLTIPDPFGQTPLFLAVYEGKADVVKYLAENLAQQAHDTIDMHNKEGYVPIHKAAKDGRLDIVTSLAENGANLTITDPFGNTPLFLAVHEGKADVVAHLAQQAHDTINMHNKEGYAPMHDAAQNGHLEIVKILVENGADLTIPDPFGNTPLFLAARYGLTDVVKYLAENLAKKAPGTIDIANQDGYSPLHTAAQNGRLDIVTSLAENGADLTITNPFGNTPLFLAVHEGKADVVAYLAQQAHDTINMHNKEGYVPIHKAAKDGRLDIVTILAENGADLTITDQYGNTPLFLAAKNGRANVVAYLAQQAHDTIDIANKDGWTPIKSAHRNRHHNLVELLAKYGATLNGVNPQNTTKVTVKKRFTGKF